MRHLLRVRLDGRLQLFGPARCRASASMRRRGEVIVVARSDLGRLQPEDSRESIAALRKTATLGFGPCIRTNAAIGPRPARGVGQVLFRVPRSGGSLSSAGFGAPLFLKMNTLPASPDKPLSPSKGDRQPKKSRLARLETHLSGTGHWAAAM